PAEPGLGWIIQLNSGLGRLRERRNGADYRINLRGSERTAQTGAKMPRAGPIFAISSDARSRRARMQLWCATCATWHRSSAKSALLIEARVERRRTTTDGTAFRQMCRSRNRYF